MNAVRTLVVVLIVALGLNGWAAQAQAVDVVSPEFSHVLGGSDRAGEADCSDVSASKAHHDHSSSADGADYCQMVSQALALHSASAGGPSWATSADLRPAHSDALAGISIPLALRPPRA
jgi:hypothetical protein